MQEADAHHMGQGGMLAHPTCPTCRGVSPIFFDSRNTSNCMAQVVLTSHQSPLRISLSPQISITSFYVSANREAAAAQIPSS